MLAASEKIPVLDGLVMLGILMLFMRHAAYAFFMINVILNQNYDPFLVIAGIDFYPLWANGWVGIDMMFVICGYVIARLWSGDSPPSYKMYLIDQAWRFLPLYYVVLLLCYVAIPFFVLPQSPTVWSVAYHLLVMPDVFEPGVNVAFAAVAAEMKFIIFLPLILILARMKRGFPVLAVVAAVAVVGGFFARMNGFSGFHPTGDIIHDYYAFFLNCRFAFFYCLDPLLMGAGVAMLEKFLRGKGGPRFSFLAGKAAVRLSFWAGFVLLLVWLGSVEQLRTITRFDATWQPLLTGTMMSMMLYGAVMGGAPGWCHGVVARHFAKLAYPIYLIHIPVIQLSFVIAATLFYPGMVEAGLSAQFWVFCAVYIVVTYIVSFALYYGIEIFFSRGKTFEPEPEIENKNNGSSYD